MLLAIIRTEPLGRYLLEEELPLSFWWAVGASLIH